MAPEQRGRAALILPGIALALVASGAAHAALGGGVWIYTVLHPEELELVIPRMDAPAFVTQIRLSPVKKKEEERTPEPPKPALAAAPESPAAAPEPARVQPPPEPPKVASPKRKPRRLVTLASTGGPSASDLAPDHPLVAADESPASPMAAEPSAEGGLPSPGAEDGASQAAEAAPPAPVAAPAPSADTAILLKGYLRTVTESVRREYDYPRAAKRAGLTGKAVVEMTIDGDGNVVEVVLVASSGHDVLDRAALESARSVKRVPAAPEQLRWGKRSVRVPFRYTITS